MTEFEDWLAKKEARRSRKGASKFERRDTTHVKRKRIKRTRKTGFSEDIRIEARERAESKCENPLCRRYLPDLGGEHHCIPRSQYKGKDRNDLWNCAHICSDCHARITFPKTEEDKRLRRYFERIAIIRRNSLPGDIESEIAKIDRELRDNTLDLIRHFQPFTT